MKSPCLWRKTPQFLGGPTHAVRQALCPLVTFIMDVAGVPDEMLWRSIFAVGARGANVDTPTNMVFHLRFHGLISWLNDDLTNGLTNVLSHSLFFFRMPLISCQYASSIPYISH